MRLALAFSLLAPLALAARWLMSAELHEYAARRGAEAWRRYDAAAGE